MADFQFEGDSGEPVHFSPVISLETTSGELLLNYFNTRIRTFLDPQYNHVEHRPDQDTLLAMQVAESLMDLLFERGFPYNYDPLVDEATVNWFVKITMGDLDHVNIDELGSTDI